MTTALRLALFAARAWLWSLEATWVLMAKAEQWGARVAGEWVEEEQMEEGRDA